MDRRELGSCRDGCRDCFDIAGLRPGYGGEEMEEMHAPKFKGLEKSSIECVATGNDCLRHCFGMYSMKDTSMAACADAAYQLVAGCGLTLRPDCAKLPYLLRAYFAFKMGLPFGYSKCTCQSK